MKLLRLSGSADLLSIKFLALSFSMLLGPSVVLAGGMPPDVEKKAPMVEESVEVEVPSPEVEKPSLEVKEPSKKEAVVEQASDTLSTEAAEEMPEAEKDSAAAASGFTVGVRGALSILNSDSLSGVAVSQYGPLGATVDYGKGYNLSLALGYSLGYGLRVEAEAGYINNGFQEINVRTPGVFAAQLGAGRNELEGDLSAITVMMNAYYDINLGGNLVPYIGGGLGAAELSSEMRSADNLLVDDGDSLFIYQVGAGLGYRISGYSDGPDITVSLDYRYLASLEDPRFKQKVTGNFVEGEFGGHYIGGGVRLGLW